MSVAEAAVRRVEAFLREYSSQYLYVDFSGGKDSAAVLAIVNDVTDKWVATYIQIAGQTHWLNVDAAYRVVEKIDGNVKVYRIVARKTGDVSRGFTRILGEAEPPLLVHVVAFSHGGGLDYWSAVEKYGFPVNVRKRWCCSKFKSEWLDERPPNGVYRNRPARFVVTGIRREESVARRRRWRSHILVFEKHVRYVDVVLAPIYDYTEYMVYEILREYNIYDVVIKQYNGWERAPNCMLCPMMGKTALHRAVANTPPALRKHVLDILKRLLKRYRDGTRTSKIIRTWTKILESYNE